MSGVFQNIDPPPPHRLARCTLTARLWCGGRTQSLGREGVGGQYLEDARHCYVLYIRKYFVYLSLEGRAGEGSVPSPSILKFANF